MNQSGARPRQSEVRKRRSQASRPRLSASQPPQPDPARRGRDRADARRFHQLVGSDTVRARAAALFAQGLQTRGPLELDRGGRIGSLVIRERVAAVFERWPGGLLAAARVDHDMEMEAPVNAPERPSHDHPADQFRPRTTGRLPPSASPASTTASCTSAECHHWTQRGESRPEHSSRKLTGHGPISPPSPLPAATPQTSFSTCKCCSLTSATMAMSTTGGAASSRTRPRRRPGSPSRLARSRSGPGLNYKLSPHTTGKEIHGRMRYRDAATFTQPGGWPPSAGSCAPGPTPATVTPPISWPSCWLSAGT
jgi:hypothetical protein